MTASKRYSLDMVSNSQLYDRDFYAWANEQAALLRAGRIQDADIANIAEEIESMGKGEKQQLISRLTVLLVHFLKWKYQPGHRSRSWELTIKEQRRKLLRLLDENPSLKPVLAEALKTAYLDAVLETEIQTGIDEAAFPQDCPWTFDETLTTGWTPT